ncbi:Kazal-type serine protease inhibitor domain-containing protein [Spirosoma agri]|uniref:Protease inhibitor Kazal-type n=1 Tax=Spirosoma agri TaxID=1987381 RepID=A0A6M0ICB9_9BACT|nr:Kazal-type serine protease inhibitor domain-containing protein [Spirosoma agri]NEU65849.1 protease inhibitor Kazal-type [Spirosoma agri]
MRRFLVLTFWLGVGAGCHKPIGPDCVETPSTTPCYCTLPATDPVCGCNGKTYTSPCAAQCVGIRFTMGACH